MSAKGLICEVYRPAAGYDCTLGGITSKATEVIITGFGIPELFSAEEKTRPALRIADRVVNRRTGESRLIALPADYDGDGPGRYAFGGNFVFSSDSRFPSRQPIPVHDRDMTRER